MSADDRREMEPTDDHDRAGEQEDGELRAMARSLAYEIAMKAISIRHGGDPVSSWTHVEGAAEIAILAYLRPLLQGKRKAEREVAEMRKTEAWAANRREDLIDERDALEAQLDAANAEAKEWESRAAKAQAQLDAILAAMGQPSAVYDYGAALKAIESFRSAANARVEELLGQVRVAMRRLQDRADILHKRCREDKPHDHDLLRDTDRTLAVLQTAHDAALPESRDPRFKLTSEQIEEALHEADGLIHDARETEPKR